MQSRKSHNASGQEGQSRASVTLSGSSPILGSSPVSGSYKSEKNQGAKKFYDRLRFDCSLDALEFVVGFIESEQQPERKSGVEAWSMRVHDVLVELPFPEFASKFAEDRVPFHRIAYYKHHGVRVWESDYHKKRLAGPDTSASPALPPMLYGPSDSSPAPGSSRARPSSLTNAPHPGWQLHGGSSSSSQQQYQAGGTSPPAPLPGRQPRGSRDSTSAGAPGGRSSTPGRPGAGLPGFTRGASSTLGGASDDDGGGVSDDDDDLALLGQRLEEEDFDDECDQEECDQCESGRELQLPEECWLKVLHQLPVRDVCMLARVNKWLRQLSGTPSVWHACYHRLFGEGPPADWPAATTRRMCRRSELRAARWLEAEPMPRYLGNPGTRCLIMDDSKVVSGDGAALRVWSHATGRRIATLQGHTGRVTCVTFDEEHVVSGCSQSTVRVWGMDDLKCSRTLRGHEDAVTGVALLPGGIPVSSSEDGTILVWDTASSQTILRLATGHPVKAITLQQPSGYLVAAAGGGIQMWDVSSGQLLHTLRPPGSGDDHAHHLAALMAAEAAEAGAHGAHHAAAAGVWDEHDDDDTDDGGFSDEDGELQFGGGGAAGEGGAGMDQLPAAPQGPLFTSVAYSGHLLAGGRADGVMLWDVRTQQHIGHLTSAAWAAIKPPVAAAQRASSSIQGSIARAASHFSNDTLSGSCPADSLTGMFNGGFGGSSPGSVPNSFSLLGSSPIASSFQAASKQLPLDDAMAPSCFASPSVAAVAAGVPGAAGPAQVPDWSCVGVQLDDWKLVVGLSDQGASRGAVVVHDIRAASCSTSQPAAGVVHRWQEPALVLHTPARIHCFQFHAQMVLAGLESEACCLWSLESPNAFAQAGASRQALHVTGSRPGVEEAGQEGDKSGRSGRKKGGKPPKKQTLQTRYPKRNGK